MKCRECGRECIEIDHDTSSWDDDWAWTEHYCDDCDISYDDYGEKVDET